MLLQNDTWRLVMNRQVNENDWILFRNRIGIWQERCYEGLTEKYLRISHFPQESLREVPCCM